MLVALAACGDGGDPTAGERRADQAREAAEAAGLPDDVVDLLGDAAGAVDATYTVTYEVAGAEGGTSLIEVTQRPPDRRVDVTADDGVIDATINVDGRTHQCVRPPDEAWRCEDLGGPPPSGGFDAEAVTALTDALVEGAGDYELSVEDDQVVGTDVRCLVTRLRAGTDDPALGDDARLCIADTGAVLLVERPVGTLRARAYRTDVDEDAFELPA